MFFLLFLLVDRTIRIRIRNNNYGSVSYNAGKKERSWIKKTRTLLDNAHFLKGPGKKALNMCEGGLKKMKEGPQGPS
jgi:hypothetical protein